MNVTAASNETGRQPVDGNAPRERVTRALASAAVVASAAMAGLGLVWLLAPGLNPFGNGEMLSLVSNVLAPAAVAVIALVLGLGGVALAVLVALSRHPSRAGIAGVGAAALALAAGLAFGSMGIVAFVGYLFGLAAVMAGILTIAVMLVRAPRLGLALLAGLIALVATSVWLAGLTVDGVVEFAIAFGGALAAEVPNLAVVAAVVATTLVWAAISISVLRSAPGGQRFEAWLVRHRRILTILAALGPVPYAVARMSWLTPWPLFGPVADELPPSMLATGLMLGAGAAAACVLTLGLILPWGRRFPAWMPRIGGRPVPVAAAVVPGFMAAGVLCISAAPMFVTIVGNPGAPADALLVNLVLPLWFWGPMLALAVWAYAAWRRDEARSE